MRFSVIAATALLSAISLSCGSSGNSGGSTPPQGDQDLGGSPGQPGNCDAAWTAYVKSHPQGLRLKYETTGSGQYQLYTNEVTASSDAAVTESHRGTSGSSESTTTKTEFLDACKRGTGTTPPQSGTIEETKKVTIKVRAGEFKTDYIRLRTTVGGTENSSALSEVWTSDDHYRFLVKSITTTDLGGTRYEVKTELLEAKIP